MPFIEPKRPVKRHECWKPWWSWLIRLGTRYQCGKCKTIWVWRNDRWKKRWVQEGPY